MCTLIFCKLISVPLFCLSDSCGYTSGSESELGEDSEGEAAQHRRTRTKFTSEQISKLENTFNKHKYLGATQRRRIAEKLNVSETQVGCVMTLWRSQTNSQKMPICHLVFGFRSHVLCNSSIIY